MKPKLLTYALIVVTTVFSTAYNDAPKPRWYGNDHFKITHDHNLVTVAMAKMPWESFSVNLEDVCCTSEGPISFSVKSSAPVTLRADAHTRNNTQVELFNEQIDSDQYQQVSYNFSNADAGISHIIFYVNPGKEFHGDLQFSDVQAHNGNEGLGIRTFPNPTSGEVQVQLPGSDFTNISLYDAAGKVVLSQQPQGKNTTLNLSNQGTGVYILKARGNASMLTTKIIVKQ